MKQNENKNLLLNAFWCLSRTCMEGVD